MKDEVLHIGVNATCNRLFESCLEYHGTEDLPGSKINIINCK